MPHAAFQGQTPDEVFFGTGDEVNKKLAEARKTARKKRMDANRAAECGVCVADTSFGALLLQRSRSRMS
jgi:putative transposase